MWLLLMNTGTGVAPFRAFIEERSFEFNKSCLLLELLSLLLLLLSCLAGCLVFGNRYKAQDYLFGEEWEEYINNGQLHVITAFSRDQVYISLLL
jgi:sulfite reductase (NADPH) flavoprotein alpha-component